MTSYHESVSPTSAIARRCMLSDVPLHCLFCDTCQCRLARRARRRQRSPGRGASQRCHDGEGKTLCPESNGLKLRLRQHVEFRHQEFHGGWLNGWRMLALRLILIAIVSCNHRSIAAVPDAHAAVICHKELPFDILTKSLGLNTLWHPLLLLHGCGYHG